MTSLSDCAVANLQQLIVADEIDDRYTVCEIVGRGGMGVVYRAHDSLLSRDVALKVFDANVYADGDAAERLKREATILAQLEHPGILPVHDVGVLADGRAFYVMRLVRGERLDEHVAANSSRGDMLRLVLRLCEAVAFANAQGVVHRDLKPSNVMIGPFGETLVLDWGVAKFVADGEVNSSTNSSRVALSSPVPVTGDGVIVGTPGFMSPEQKMGKSADVDQTADVYGLGAIMRALIPVSAASGDRALQAIVTRATAELPSGRYQSARELGDDIRRWLDGTPVLVYRENAWERFLRAYRKHQTAIWLVAAYMTLRVAILLWRHI